MKIALTLFTSMVLLLGTAGADPIDLEDSNGKILRAEILEVKDGKARIKRSRDGKIFTLDMAMFADETQTILKAYEGEPPVEGSPLPAAGKSPELELSASVAARRKQQKNSINKSQFINTTIKVLNKDRDLAFSGGKVIFHLIGRDMKIRNRYVIMATETIDKGVAGGKTLTHECKQIVTTFDDDQNEKPNIGGIRYHGYALLALDASGQVISSKLSHGGMRKHSGQPGFLEKVAKYDVKTGISRELLPFEGK